MVNPKKPSKRLNLQEAKEVWRLRSMGWLQHHIAAHFGVNQGRISEILTGKLHPEAIPRQQKGWLYGASLHKHPSSPKPCITSPCDEYLRKAK